MTALGHLAQLLSSLKMVISPRAASVCCEAKRSLQTIIIGQYKIMHRVGTVEAPAHISEILQG